MMRRSYYWLLAAATMMGTTACDGPNTSMIVLGHAQIDLDIDENTGAFSCAFNPTGTPFLNAFIDFRESSAMTIPYAVENRMPELSDDFGSSQRPEPINFANSASPVRVELQWLCDTTGFLGAGPLVVPDFDPEIPICEHTRLGANANFVGLDTVTVEGAAIGAGQTGVALTRVIPAETGAAFAKAFQIGQLAEECCVANDCLGTPNAPQDPSCVALEEIFVELTRISGRTFTTVGAGNVPSQDLIDFRPFGLFSGPDAPYYQMRLAGVMEYQLNSGELLTTSEFLDVIAMCHDCPPTPLDPALPLVRESNPCFHQLH